MKKGYTLFVVLLPILTIYRSPIPFLDMGSFVMIILMIFIIRNKLVRENGAFFIKRDIWFTYIIYISVITAVGITIGVSYNPPINSIMRAVKNILYMVFTLLLYREGLFVFRYAEKYYRKATIICTGFIFFQYLVYKLFHYGLSGYITSLIYTEGYRDTVDLIAKTALFRPTSFFYEPAHYFEYVCVAIVLALFYNTKEKYYLLAAFLTVGVFISTSGQGIVFSAFLWGIWILKNLKKHSRRTLICCAAGFMTVILMGVYLLFSTKGIQIMSRIIGSGYGGNAIVARATGYKILKGLGALSLLFGNGYGNVPGGMFFSGWAFDLYCLGILGTLIIVAIYVKYYRLSQFKMIVILNALMSIFSTVSLGFCFVFNFSFILSKLGENNDPREECYCNN